MPNGNVSRRLTVEETALCTAYLIHMYASEKGKDVTRFRLSRHSVRLLGIRANLREPFVYDWIEELASVWGWIAFPHGEEFGLVHTSVVSGWVRIGTKRFAEYRSQLKRGDRSVLDEMQEALAHEQADDDQSDD